MPTEVTTRSTTNTKAATGFTAKATADAIANLSTQPHRIG